LKLFKRQYIVRNKKTGSTNADWYSIDNPNEMVKSAELTGSWEKQLKDIEKELLQPPPLSII
jgi:DNA topoisomerase-3